MWRSYSLPLPLNAPSFCCIAYPFITLQCRSRQQLYMLFAKCQQQPISCNSFVYVVRKNHPNIVDPLVLDYPHPVLYANYLKIQCKDTFFTSVPILLHICRLTISSLDSTQSSDLPLSQLFRLKSKFILHSQFEGTCRC